MPLAAPTFFHPNSKWVHIHNKTIKLISLNIKYLVFALRTVEYVSKSICRFCSDMIRKQWMHASFQILYSWQDECAALLKIITTVACAVFSQVPFMRPLSSVVDELWCVALNCPQMWTCWQQLAYSTAFNSNTDTLCHNSGLEAVERQACHCTPILLTNGWFHRTHSLEWWMGPLHGIGDAAAALGVHPGACVW